MKVQFYIEKNRNTVPYNPELPTYGRTLIANFDGEISQRPQNPHHFFHPTKVCLMNLTEKTIELFPFLSLSEYFEFWAECKADQHNPAFHHDYLVLTAIFLKSTYQREGEVKVEIGQKGAVKGIGSITVKGENTLLIVTEDGDIREYNKFVKEKLRRKSNGKKSKNKRRYRKREFAREE